MSVVSFIKELPRRGYEVPFKKALLYFQHAQLPVLHPRHTVEELQSFVNVRTPSPPWVHVVRLVIPTASCDEAAVYLIKAFGGEDVMKRVVGGTKWWQVRGTRGYVPFSLNRTCCLMHIFTDWTPSGSVQRKTGRMQRDVQRSARVLITCHRSTQQTFLNLAIRS